MYICEILGVGVGVIVVAVVDAMTPPLLFRREGLSRHPPPSLCLVCLPPEERRIRRTGTYTSNKAYQHFPQLGSRHPVHSLHRSLAPRRLHGAPHIERDRQATRRDKKGAARGKGLTGSFSRGRRKLLQRKRYLHVPHNK